MDWLEIAKALLTGFSGNGLIDIAFLVITIFVVPWLRKKYQIDVTKEQLDKAKRSVLAIEEAFKSGAMRGNKKVEAINRMAENSKLPMEIIERRIDEAVAELPGIGATGKPEVNIP
jgi:hypothetical protein